MHCYQLKHGNVLTPVHKLPLHAINHPYCDKKAFTYMCFCSRSPGPFVRTPETFSNPPSAPATPMSQRRRLKINQSPKPIESENKPNYREHLTANAFQPGFYRPPPEDATQAPMFQLTKGKSRSGKEESVRMSQTSFVAYEGDSEF